MRTHGYKLEWSTPPRSRMTKNFQSITCLPLTCFPITGRTASAARRNLWWYEDDQMWDYHRDSCIHQKASHCPNIKTLQAGLKHLRQHEAELWGQKVIFINRWLGFNVSVRMEF